MSLNLSLYDQELKALIKAINLVEDIASDDRTDCFTEAELDTLAMLQDCFYSAVEDWD